MLRNLKKMLGYYRPYMKVFFLDLFFAFVVASVSLVLPRGRTSIVGL